MLCGFLAVLSSWLALMRAPTPSVSSSFPALLQQFRALPDSELERFTPQLASLLTEEGVADALGSLSQEQALGLRQLERQVLKRCSGNFRLGYKLHCAMKSYRSSAESEVKRSGFPVLFPIPSRMQQSWWSGVSSYQTRNEVVDKLKEKIRSYTLFQRDSASGSGIGERHRYFLNIILARRFKDLESITDKLTILSSELVSKKGSLRREHFLSEISNINRLFLHSSSGDSNTHVKNDDFFSGDVEKKYVCDGDILSLSWCTNPENTFSSQAKLYPLLQSQNQRMLRIIPEECCLLSSKEHCPLLIYTETLSQLSRMHLSPCSAEGIGSLRNLRLNQAPTSPPFRETWKNKLVRIQYKSPFSHLSGWKVKPFIVKADSDLKREELAMQYIHLFKDIFTHKKVGIILKPYEIMATSSRAGLIEFLDGAISIDLMKRSVQYCTNISIQVTNGHQPIASSAIKIEDQRKKQSLAYPTSLKQYFVNVYGHSNHTLCQAIENFARSLAGYSLVTYILQVKDRHNGNILLDEEGHMIHIDFGFILGEYPGAFNINFETSPFKITPEYIELLGGLESENFKLFQELFVAGLSALHNHTDVIVAMTKASLGESTTCSAVVNALKKRLEIGKSEIDSKNLINESMHSASTHIYDLVQESTNGILM